MYVPANNYSRISGTNTVTLMIHSGEFQPLIVSLVPLYNLDEPNIEETLLEHIKYNLGCSKTAVGDRIQNFLRVISRIILVVSSVYW